MIMQKNIKLLCTLGPSSMDPKIIERLDQLGVDVFRINLSHTKIEDLKNIIVKIKTITQKPICLDTEGAQIRNRYVENDKVYLEANSLLRITGDNSIGTNRRISLNPNFIIKKIVEGDIISIDFNAVLVHALKHEGKSILARVISGGYLGSNKAVTIIDRKMDLPVLTSKDRKAVDIALTHGIRFFALSFAANKEAVESFRAVVGEDSHVISKIESHEGVLNIDNILDVSDSILIDRGDLSREEPIELIPFLQKMLIRKANEKNVPVYVATNLLESMVRAKSPTRAEVNDIINTLLDGANGLVLAAETAVGKYPLLCATMISSLINQHDKFHQGYSLASITLNDCPNGLTKPHGGELINRINDCPDYEYLETLPSMEVDRSVLMDLEQIAIGTFSPLKGFMNSTELDSVLTNYRLSSGIVCPLPIVLQVSKDKAMRYKEGQTIALALRENGKIYGTICIEEIYSGDLDKYSEQIFGTTDGDHPGVSLFKERGEYFIAGPIELIRRLPGPCKKYELTPRQTRAIFENKGWSRIVAFHTRNVIHRAHEAIQMMALKGHNCDGLFVHPIVGFKKNGDYSANIILKSYELMIEKHYPRGKAILGAFSTYSRYAGPREAVFTALCRKNFGCSHFIVGRDHTGVKGYYGPEDAHELFRNLGDIGITPIFFNNVYFSKQSNSYVEAHGDHTHDALSISGTKARELLRSGECPPDWFMREEISKIILDEIAVGKEVFVN